MKNVIAKLLGFLLLLMLLSVVFHFPMPAAYAEVVEPNYYEVLSATDGKPAKEGGPEVLPSEWKKEESNGAKLLSAEESKGYGGEVISLPPDSAVSFGVNVPKAGNYHILVDYYLPEQVMEDLTVSLQINGAFPFYECRNIKLPAVWRDTAGDYKKDEYGNDIFPSPERVFRWQTSALNTHKYNLSTPLLFPLEAGANTITMENNQVPVMLGKITVSAELGVLIYAQYKDRQKDKPVAGQTVWVTEGEDYAEKSESYIRGEKSNDHNVQPYDPARKQINYLAPETWQKPGESVTYRFDIKENGLYHISLKYKQNEKKDLSGTDGLCFSLYRRKVPE